jgi:RNA polymerase sigma-70 factor, ECF subfamily
MSALVEPAFDDLVVIDPHSGDYLPLALDILTVRGDRIADVTAFRTPAMFPRFGLPDRLRG